MGAFFLGFILFVLWLNMSRPTVLILHSYSTDYIWTREINVGLERILEQESWLDIRYHYMGTKKKGGKNFKHRAGVAARKAIDDMQPDVLIAIDDNAQKLAAKHYINDPKMKIVFAGVNGCQESYGYREATNATGILECKPVDAVEELVKMLFADHFKDKLPKAVFASDTSFSASIDAKFLTDNQWTALDFQSPIAFDTFEAWQSYVRTVDNTADLLLVGAYRKMYRNDEDKANERKFVTSTEVGSWTEANSPIPVIGINDFNTRDGIMISVGASPYEQGETAAEYALHILKDGKEIKDIPITSSEQYLVAMRKSALEKRGIHAPKVLEAFARATENYFE
ncbi:ABC transporter substrate binding protein [Terasakiella sp. SH-1]|uniref:ABC transporter substrate-binding protein n=1 Tax=Terasakiella sp. SH-1 TaxID=2560057 RepID=UPI001432098F|nr:ABC transporter substrate binding protein [Terasakiella sp. SH-1]